MAGKGDKPDLEQLLSSYIDGTCSDQERQQVEEALQRDPRLRALHAELGRTVDAIRAVPSEAAPGYVRERILSQLERRALLGIGSAGAGEPARGAGRRRSTGWLGLLAAAMLVAGVGVTWWVRVHQEKASYQVAMAPTTPAEDDRVAGRLAPLETDERMQELARADQPADSAGRQRALKTVQPAVPLAQDLSPETGPASPPLQSAQPTVPAQPQAPVMADRGGQDAARSEPSAAPMLDQSLAMSEQPSRAASAGKPQVVQSFGSRMAETTVAPAAEAAPQPDLRTVQSGPGGAGNGSGLVSAMARSKGAPSADALAAAPAHKDTADLVTKDTGDLAAKEAAPAPAPMIAEVPAATMARAAPARSAGVYWRGSGRVQEMAEPAVTQLQVSVRDVGQQLALTSGVIREWVRQEGGQTTQSPGAPMIVAAVPPGSQGLLTEMIKKGPGVLQVQTRDLPPSHPLARQASSVASEQQWLQSAAQLVGWAASWKASWTTQTRIGPDLSVTFQDVPRIIPQDHVPMVIVLQPVAPAAASEPANQ